MQQPEQTSHKFTNALAGETSPYLLQHAHNPVNWQPWSQGALEQAKQENKLVLVSIGYSSCHWCHVMEEETFEDEGVAKIMNANFISIKVDREERPDIDHIYMTALQLMTGNGGWPLNVITLPNGKPLYGGTYHTKEQWTQVLTKIGELYIKNPAKAEEYAAMVAEGIAQANLVEPVSDYETLTKENLQSGVANWRPLWDLEAGGDQGPQKFMIPTNLDFLLNYALLTNNPEVKAHVKQTLDQIVMGGVYDQVAGGLYRYSTDAKWHIPHFEKMLYDNAQAIGLFSRAYAVFKEPAYKELVMETLAFLEREMQHEQGGFYAAIDADSEGEEGKFYLWKESELQAILGKDFELFATYYDIAPETVWENDNYVLHRITNDTDFVKRNEITKEALVKAKVRWKKQLLEARNKRIRPRIDDKIITSWNAMLISGLVEAYKVFGDETFLENAETIFSFLINTSYNGGILVHSYKEGSKRKEGFLEDYAFLIQASLDLYTVSMKVDYLDFSQKLIKKVQTQFADPSGMYRYTDSDDLIAKIIKTDDGVLPSPNSVMAHNLFRSGHLMYDLKMIESAKKMLSAMVPFIMRSAPSYGHWAKLLMHESHPFFEVAVVGSNAGQLTKELHQQQPPNTLIVGSDVDSGLPLFEDRYFEDGTFIYVCQNSSCKLPVETVEKALKQIKEF